MSSLELIENWVNETFQGKNIEDGQVLASVIHQKLAKDIPLQERKSNKFKLKYLQSLIDSIKEAGLVLEGYTELTEEIDFKQVNLEILSKLLAYTFNENQFIETVNSKSEGFKLNSFDPSSLQDAKAIAVYLGTSNVSDAFESNVQEINKLGVLPSFVDLKSIKDYSRDDFAILLNIVQAITNPIKDDKESTIVADVSKQDEKSKENKEELNSKVNSVSESDADKQAEVNRQYSQENEKITSDMKVAKDTITVVKENLATLEKESQALKETEASLLEKTKSVQGVEPDAMLVKKREIVLKLKNKFEEELTTLQIELESKTKECSELKNKLEHQKAEYEQSIANNKEASKDIENEIAVLEKSNQALQQQIDQLKGEPVSDSEVKVLTNEVETLSKENQELNTQIEQLKQDLEVKKMDHNNYESTLKTQTEKLQQAKESLGIQNEQVTSEVNRLKQDNSNLLSESEKLKTELDNLSKGSLSESPELKELKQTVESLSQSQSELTNELKELSNTKQKLSEDIENDKKSIHEGQESKIKSEQALKDLIEQKENLKVSVAKLQQESDSVNKEVEILKSQSSELNQQAKTVESELKEMQQKSKTVEQESPTLRENTEKEKNLKTHIKHKTTHRNQLRTDILNIEENIKSWEKQISELDLRIISNENKKKVKAIEKEKALNKRIRELEENLKTLEESIKKEDTKKEALLAELKEKESKYARSKEIKANLLKHKQQLLIDLESAKKDNTSYDTLKEQETLKVEQLEQAKAENEVLSTKISQVAQNVSELEEVVNVLKKKEEKSVPTPKPTNVKGKKEPKQTVKKSTPKVLKERKETSEPKVQVDIPKTVESKTDASDKPKPTPDNTPISTSNPASSEKNKKKKKKNQKNVDTKKMDTKAKSPEKVKTTPTRSLLLDDYFGLPLGVIVMLLVCSAMMVSLQFVNKP